MGHLVSPDAPSGTGHDLAPAAGEPDPTRLWWRGRRAEPRHSTAAASPAQATSVQVRAAGSPAIYLPSPAPTPVGAGLEVVAQRLDVPRPVTVPGHVTVPGQVTVPEQVTVPGQVTELQPVTEPGPVTELDPPAEEIPAAATLSVAETADRVVSDAVPTALAEPPVAARELPPTREPRLRELLGPSTSVSPAQLTEARVAPAPRNPRPRLGFGAPLQRLPDAIPGVAPKRPPMPAAEPHSDTSSPPAFGVPAHPKPAPARLFTEPSMPTAQPISGRAPSPVPAGRPDPGRGVALTASSLPAIRRDTSAERAEPCVLSRTATPTAIDEWPATAEPTAEPTAAPTATDAPVIVGLMGARGFKPLSRTPPRNETPPPGPVGAGLAGRTADVSAGSIRHRPAPAVVQRAATRTETPEGTPAYPMVPMTVRATTPAPEPPNWSHSEEIVVQRTDDPPETGETSAPLGDSTTPTPQPATPAGAPAAVPAGGSTSPTEVDALVRRIYDPIVRCLKAELRLDRERAGRTLDLRH